jgi:hypothetical protein
VQMRPEGPISLGDEARRKDLGGKKGS